MAFDILPSTFEEAGKAVKFMNETSAIEALALYRHLIQHYGHIVKNPLAFDSEKVAFYKARGHSPSDHTHIESDGTSRVWTEAEWEDHIIEHMPHPDVYNIDLSYIGKRREEYPSEEEQLDAFYKSLKYMKDRGTDIGPDGDSIVLKIAAVKEKYPKPTTL